MKELTLEGGTAGSIASSSQTSTLSLSNQILQLQKTIEVERDARMCNREMYLCDRKMYLHDREEDRKRWQHKHRTCRMLE